MSKVRPEAFLWGAGTALGELPPYFMAKAARLSGYDPEDADDLKEFEELQKKKQTGEKLNVFDRAKLFMEKIVERVGFFGILACASVSKKTFYLVLPKTFLNFFITRDKNAFFHKRCFC
jgi:vacuole membrane protein 1